ncbi:uncharacterized protein LOC116675108 [Etheostoma spectabile]|uniref:uncharacterized protein LOC116675108 n=1 Tax=Etheostoma spectabile TaxID=54343 RepID=UPI0013AF15AA|nr:uncharacterized protein LOC116675108 [Etheostoma spectabile]
MAARPGQRSRCFSQSFLPIAVCWLILLVIMGLRIYFTNRNLNLQELETKRKILTGPIQNISRARWSINEYCPKVQNECTPSLQLVQTLGLRAEGGRWKWIDGSDLPERMIRPPQDDIEEMEEEAAADYVNAPARTGKKMAARPVTNRILNNNSTGPAQNISRAQWSIDEYCPKGNNVSERRCGGRQEGWVLCRSSCYLFAGLSDLKTWEEAREDCRARSSDLVVVHDEDEQDALSLYSRYGPWIGLRAEGGRWKWIDGRDLTERVSRWIHKPPPTDGQCVISVRGVRLVSLSCAERWPWICQKKSLSV